MWCFLAGSDLMICDGNTFFYDVEPGDTLCLSYA